MPEGAIMNIIRLLAALVVTVAAMPSFAEDADSGAIVGKVVKIYVRESNNFYIETNLVRSIAGKQHWTEVRFAAPLADGRTSEIVRLPEATKVEQGDLVSTQLADKRDFIPGLIPEVNRMVGLVAKHDSLAAMTFGMPKPLPNAALPFLQAQQASR
jgi:hypothetical protein